MIWSAACPCFPRGTDTMRTLQEEFSRVEIGRSSEFRNLILFPLMRQSAPVQPLDYLLLEDGIAQGKVRVTELHAGGSVPELRLENNSRSEERRVGKE